MSRAGGALERPSNADAVAPQDATRSVDSRRPRLADATRNEPVGGFPNRDGIVRVSDAVKSLPIVWLRWLVLGVVVYAAFPSGMDQHAAIEHDRVATDWACDRLCNRCHRQAFATAWRVFLVGKY
jgi:hypothetical protein